MNPIFSKSGESYRRKMEKRTKNNASLCFGKNKKKTLNLRLPLICKKNT